MVVGKSRLRRPPVKSLTPLEEHFPAAKAGADFEALTALFHSAQGRLLKPSPSKLKLAWNFPPPVGLP
jgi:hypothetical protein